MTEAEADAKAAAVRAALQAFAVEHGITIAGAFAFGPFVDQDGDKSHISSGFAYHPQKGSDINDMINIATKIGKVQKQLAPLAKMGKALGMS